MSYKVKDHYFKKAKKENFAARSVYKLDEIDRRFHLLKAGQRVLDLGAAPGSWSQYCSKQVGDKGVVIGIDLTPITIRLGNAHFIQGDILTMNLQETLSPYDLTTPFDLVISDMAPKTTGIKITDQMRSFELCQMALTVAQKYLKPGGNFVCKFFHSDEFKNLQSQMQQAFKRVEAIRPESTRSASKEIFLVGISKKAGG